MKRIICVMLTLIMLVSLVPATAITASAATMSTSSGAITVLKEMLSFKSSCYQIDGTKEFRIGYGAICKEEHKKSEFNDKGIWLGVGGMVAAGREIKGNPHTMNEKTATNLLNQAMKSMDNKVNSFASNNSLSLKQGQFDALSLFSYLTGTAWMNGSGNVKTAVKTGADSTKLMNAFNAVLNNPERSKILTNMYFNGIYSNDISENYSEVTYDAKGGAMPVEDVSYKLVKAAGNTYKMYFDASKSVAHPVTPTRNGYKFMGWYFQGNETIGGRSTALNSACKDKTLIALWQGNGTNPDNADKDYGEGGATTVWYELPKSSLATQKFYAKPSKDAHVWDEKVSDRAGNTIWIGKEYLASDGSRWVRTNKAQEWMLLSNAPGSSSGSSSSGGGSGRIGVNVTNTYVNVRKEPNIYSAKIGTLNYNKRVYISSTETANGFLWGHAYESHGADEAIGWIALMYTDYNTVKDSGSSSGSSAPKPTNTVIAKATVTYNGYVNMRDIAGTDSKIVGSLAKNEIVSIYEIKTVNGHQWGRTNGGWFCLTYANVEMIQGSSDISNSGSKDYTFTATWINPAAHVYENTTTESNFVTPVPKDNSTVSVVTLRVSGEDLWAKIGWTYKDDKGKNVTKYGWVQAGNKNSGLSTGIEPNTNTNPAIILNAVNFTVVADSVNARKTADSGASIVTKLNKGYQFSVRRILPVGEDVWGYTELKLNSDDKEGDYKEYGWVNLASKYAKRSDLVGKDTPPAQEENHNRHFAKIIGADRVNVRAEAKITSKLVGQLGRNAVVEILDWDNGWFRVDADVDNNPNTDSWVYGEYVEESEQSSDIANAPSSHGTGVVANTYAGVNVRRGPSTGHAIVGTKLLPGTQVKILETTYTGITKWGRIGDSKWVCMDYISMTNEVVDVPEAPKPEAPNGGTWVGDYDEIDRTTTTAVYTGKANGTVNIWANTEHHDKTTDTSHVVRTLGENDPVTIYELIAVVEKMDINEDENVDNAGGGVIDKTITHFWARTNDGYILDPQKNITLNALDEKAHTLTGSDTLNVRADATENSNSLGKLKKGDVVNVTALKINNDKVWGRIEYSEDDVYVEDGWIRLDYMSEGAFYKEEKPAETQPPVNNTPAPPSNNNSTGDTGKSDGTYRYDGKIKSEVRLRQQATTASAEVSKLKAGTKIYIYETTLSNGMAWGRCDGGWVSLYYVKMIPRDPANGIEARVVYRATDIYSDANRSEKTGSYTAQAVVDIYEVVGSMARTELGWVNTGDLL